MSETIEAPSGLRQVLDLLDRDEQPPMGRLMDVRLIEASEGRAVFEGLPGEQHYNPMGGVHGGYAAGLLDSACGIAVHTMLQPGQGYTTIELKISYIRGMTARTGPVRAEGRVVNMGRRVAFSEAEIRDGEGRLIATASSTLLVINP